MESTKLGKLRFNTEADNDRLNRVTHSKLRTMNRWNDPHPVTNGDIILLLQFIS